MPTRISSTTLRNAIARLRAYLERETYSCEYENARQFEAVTARQPKHCRNAQRWTGPMTEGGKAVSRQNAVKHGILACKPAITFPIAEQQQYEALAKYLSTRTVDGGLCRRLFPRPASNPH